MLEFTKQLIVTGAEQRTKKDGSTYILIHVLGDSGVTVSCLYKGDSNKVLNLEKMKVHNISFSLNVGKYTQLTIADIDLVK